MGTLGLAMVPLDASLSDAFLERVVILFVVVGLCLENLLSRRETVGLLLFILFHQGEEVLPADFLIVAWLFQEGREGHFNRVVLG